MVTRLYFKCKRYHNFKGSSGVFGKAFDIWQKLPLFYVFFYFFTRKLVHQKYKMPNTYQTSPDLGQFTSLFIGDVGRL